MKRTEAEDNEYNNEKEVKEGEEDEQKILR